MAWSTTMTSLGTRLHRDKSQWEGMIHSANALLWIGRVVTKPIRDKAPDFAVRLPFSSLYFRPYLSHDAFMAFGVWEPYVLSNINLRDGDLFIDIGAYIGYYTLQAARKVGDDGLVVAFEPDKRNLRLLRESVAKAGFRNIDVHGCAAGKDGYVRLELLEYPSYTRTVESDQTDPSRVKSMSLNTLLEEIKKVEINRGKPFGATVLKIDAEGAESEILENGMEFIEQKRPTIIAEAAVRNPLGESAECLEELDYESIKVQDAYLVLKPKREEVSVEPPRSFD